MKDKVNLIKNTFFTSLSNFSNVFLLILLLVAGRFLGAEEFGKLTFSLALVSSIGMISDLGTLEIVKRSVSRKPYKAQYYFGNILTWKTILSVISIILTYILINILKSERDIRLVVYILSIAILIKTLKTIPLTFFQALERFELHALFQTIHNVALLICGVVSLICGAQLFFFAIMFTSIKVIDCILTYLVTNKKLFKIRFEFDFRLIKKIQLIALPLGLFAIINQAYGYADTIMIGIISSNSQVGIYNAAYKIFEGLSIFPIILTQATSPQLFRLFIKDKEMHFKLCQKVIKYSLVVSIPIIIFGIFLSDKFILMLYGRDYIESVLGLKILLIGFMTVSLNYILHLIIISIDKQKILAPILLIGFIFNIFLNIILIPMYGSDGAAAATTICSMLVFILGYFYLGRTYRWFSLFGAIAKSSFSVFIITAIVNILQLKIQIFHLVFVVPLYLTLLIFTKFFDDEELKYIKMQLVSLRLKCVR